MKALVVLAVVDMMEVLWMVAVQVLEPALLMEVEG